VTVLHGAGPLMGYSFISLIGNILFRDIFLVTDHITCLYIWHVILTASTVTNGKTYNHQCAYMLFNQTVQWVVMSHCLVK